MEFKGCTVVSNKLAKEALDNYKLRKEEVSLYIREAKKKYLEDNQGTTRVEGVLWWKKEIPLTASEVLLDEVSLFTGTYNTIAHKLSCLGYIEEYKISDVYAVNITDNRWHSEESSLYKLESLGGDNYITPAQAAFISNFRTQPE